MGRKETRDWSVERLEEIEGRILCGEAIRNICKSYNMPESTFWRKFSRDESFAQVISRAMETRQIAEVERTVDLADTATPDDWQAVRLQIWARQWRAEKMAPKKFGAKMDITAAVNTVILPPNPQETGRKELPKPDFDD